MNSGIPLKGSHRGWFIGLIPLFPAEHQQDKQDFSKIGFNKKGRQMMVRQGMKGTASRFLERQATNQPLQGVRTGTSKCVLQWEIKTYKPPPRPHHPNHPHHPPPPPPQPPPSSPPSPPTTPLLISQAAPRNEEASGPRAGCTSRDRSPAKYKKQCVS